MAWTLEEHTANSVSLQYRLMAQTGYPWLLDLHVLYDLSANGLTVTQTATNMGDAAAPYASGAHPYLTAGQGAVDAWELTLPAATRSLPDERLLPVGTESVEGTAYDFRVARPLRDTVLNHAFTDLDRDSDGRATVTLLEPASGLGVALWVDEKHGWLQVYTADDVAPEMARRSVAVEPMTANADAFRSGADLVTLAPAGEPGDEHSVSWGTPGGRLPVESAPHGSGSRLTPTGSATGATATGVRTTGTRSPGLLVARALVDQRPQLAAAVLARRAVGALDAHHGGRVAVGEVEGDPRRARWEVDADHLRPFVLVASVAVDHDQAVHLRVHAGPDQRVERAEAEPSPARPPCRAGTA